MAREEMNCNMGLGLDMASIVSKQAEIREGVAQRLYWSAYVGGDWDTAVQQELYRAKAKKVLEYLHSEGVKLANGKSLIGGKDAK